MNVRSLAIVVALLVPTLAGCASSPPPSGGPTDVLVSFYPLAYLTQRIVGNSLHVGAIIPADVEPHDYELKPSDVAAMSHAKLLVLQGTGLEIFLDDAIKNAQDAHVPYVVTTTGLESQNSSDSQEPGLDPHTWVDPVMAMAQARAIAARVEAIDPAHAQIYRANLESLLADLRGVDAAYRAGLSHCAKPRIITTHAAFGYLAGEYNFTQFAVSGISPEAEPSAAKVKEAVDLAKRENITTIFFETLVNPALAQAIAAELPSAKTAVLDPIEGIPDEAAAHGEDYLTIQLENLDQLRAAMECA